MFVRKFRLPSIVFAAIVLAANLAWADGLVNLGKTKEQLELKYDVSVKDHGTGRVTVNLTIADLGKLKKLDAVDLVIPGKDGANFVDLSLSLATREVDGKQTVHVHLTRELAKRAQIKLMTHRFDGVQGESTWYYHSISIAEHLKGEGLRLTVIKWSEGFEIVGTRVKGIKLADLAQALRKHHKQHPGMAYEVYAEVKAVPETSDEIIDTIRNSGVTLKHYWAPVSDAGGHFVKNSEFFDTPIWVPKPGKYGIGHVDILN